MRETRQRSVSGSMILARSGGSLRSVFRSSSNPSDPCGRINFAMQSLSKLYNSLFELGRPIALPRMAPLARTPIAKIARITELSRLTIYLSWRSSIRPWGGLGPATFGDSSNPLAARLRGSWEPSWDSRLHAPVSEPSLGRPPRVLRRRGGRSGGRRRTGRARRAPGTPGLDWMVRVPPRWRGRMPGPLGQRESSRRHCRGRSACTSR